MVFDPKGLAAEIEAVKLALHQRLPIADEFADDAAKHIVRTVIAPRLAEIAALQSRAFEDGARWMRERADGRVRDRAYLMEHGEEQAAVLRAAGDLASLPSSPKGSGAMRKLTSLSEAFEDSTVSIMLNRSPDGAHAESNAERIRADITERQKRRLFLQMEQRFKAWTGESFIGFTARRAALAEQEKGDS